MEAKPTDMANETRDQQSGRYETAYEDAEFVDAVRERGGMASTRQVADTVGCDRDTAYRRLRSLAEDGGVSSEDIGNTMLWKLASPVSGPDDTASDKIRSDGLRGGDK